MPEIKHIYSILSNSSARSELKDLKQIYAFPAVSPTMWSEQCISISLAPDTVNGWKAFATIKGEDITWSIDGWRRIRKFRATSNGRVYE